VVGIFGELKPKKGLELLLAQLDFSRFALEIVGELRPDAEKLLHGFLCLHPQSAIRHLPWVGDRAALGARYGAVDIVCIPSLHEGMSNVMLEAMASGALCVCSKVGGAPDVIAHGENGLLFDPFPDGAELARALDEAAAMLADGRAEALRRAARRTIEARFSSARERAAYLDDLRALLA
jgi:glycosyltransferase involved in cell wall biosynthesis